MNVRVSMESSTSLQPSGLPASVLGAASFCLTSAATFSSAFAQSASSGDQTQIAQDTTSRLQIEQIVVTGVRPLLSTKLPDLQNAPQSINVIGQPLLQQEAVTRLQDALRNVPGITLNAGEGTARGDTVNLRGFSAFNDFFLDGIRDAAIYDRDSFDTEEVEVLKGPSAVLFGRGSTGGVINQVSKAPTLTPLKSGVVQVGTNDEIRATADVDQPLTATSALRLNVMDEHSDVADRSNIRNNRWGVAPSYALGLGQDTSLVVTYLHQQENNIPDTGIPFIGNAPAQVPRNSDYGLLSNRFTADDDIGTVRLKHDFSADVSLSDTFRYASYRFGNFISAPNFGSNVPTLATPLSAVLVGRDDPSSSGKQTNLTNQTDLTARFNTGAVSQVVVAGVEYSRQTSAINRYNNPFNSNNTWIPETPLLSPNPGEVAPVEPITSNQDTIASSYAAYLIDTVHVGKYVNVTLGGRYDRFVANFVQDTLTTGAITTLAHTDNVWSPRAALVFAPTETQSYYVSYGTSFDPSAEALSLSAKTANLLPQKAHTYEAGGKGRLLDGQLLATGAIFRTEIDNAQTNDPDNPAVTILAGDQRVDGFELGLTGYLTEKWEINAGYTYLNAVTIASGTAAYVGKFLPNVGRNNLTLWTEYELTDRWEFGAGAFWISHRFADMAATVNVPGYVTFNAMASYKVNDYVKVQVNGTNLGNKYYYSGLYYTTPAENHVVPGAGRTFTLTTSVNF